MIRSVLFCLFVLVALPAQAQLGKPARPSVPLPGGPLRNVLLKNCVSCHGIDDYAYFAFSRENWDALLTDKHKGMKVNTLSVADKNLLLDYLEKNFGIKSAPFPRKYIPPEIDTYWTDVEGRKELDAVCTKCHELDRVYESRHPIDRWRTVVLEMRQRGATLPDDANMERLVEWLSRVQSANLFE